MPQQQRVGPPRPERPLCSVPKLLILTGFAVVVCNFFYRSPPVKPVELPVTHSWEPPQPRPTATPIAPVATPPALDGTAEAALRLAVPLGHGPVLLTFGDSKIGAMLDNFVAHASAAGAPFVIGAVDGAAFELFAAKQTVAIYLSLIHI